LAADEAPPFDLFVAPERDLARFAATSRLTDRAPLFDFFVAPGLLFTLLAGVVFCLRSKTRVGVSERALAGVVACGPVEALTGALADGLPVPASPTPAPAS
jgi:hypothetical protein